MMHVVGNRARLGAHTNTKARMALNGCRVCKAQNIACKRVQNTGQQDLAAGEPFVDVAFHQHDLGLGISVHELSPEENSRCVCDSCAMA